ncbi:MAG: hypothetical protein ACPG4N_07630, partial [Gammaproteobacteria bacterium]
NHLKLDVSKLDEAPDELLVNGLITGMPFSPEDAQSLIETAPLAERHRLLAGLMSVAAEPGQGTPGATPTAKH